MKKSFFYRIMVLSLGALLAGIIACKNPASPDPVNPEQNVQTPSDNGLGGGGTPNPKPGEPTPGGGGGGGGGGGDGPAPTPNPVNPQTDQERVEAAKAVLELRVNENNGKVKYRIDLPSRGAYDTSISWTSSSSEIINTNEPNVGEVTRQEDDTEVTLTATITKGSAMATKTFTVTVYGKNQELVDRAVEAMRQPPAFVMGNPAPSLFLESSTLIINGPNPATDHIEIPLTWTAEPEGIIDVWGVVTQPAEKKTVTLTATAKKGNATASRTFTVTVYPKNQTPSLDELLTQIMDTIPAETDKHIPLMGTVASGYTLKWTSSDNSVLNPNPAYGGSNITRDLVDRKVTLTAKLSKNDSPSETAQKEKEVTVKKQTKFDDCELAGNLLTMRDYDRIVSAVYSVQIDGGAKKITAAAEQAVYNGTLMTLDAIQQQQLAELDSGLQFDRSLLSLCDKPIVTLKELKDAYAKAEPEAATASEEEVFNGILGGFCSYAEFLNKSAEEQTQIIKEKFLNPYKKSVYNVFQIPLDTPLEQALAQMKEQQTARINARIENAKKPRAYTYRVEFNRLYTEAPYVSGTPWYQQPGPGAYLHYDHNDIDPDHIKAASLSTTDQGNGKYNVSISIRKKGSPNEDRFQASGYDGSGAITAKTDDGSKQITVTVTDDGAGSVKVTSTGEVSFTDKRLGFRGHSIPRNPLRFILRRR